MAQPNPQPAVKSDNTIWIYLSYILGFVLGLIGLAVVKDDAKVRFHCAQAVVLSGAFWIVNLIGWILSAILAITIILPIIIGIVQFLIGAAYCVYTILIIIKVAQGNDFRVPYAGDFAEKNVVNLFK